jgi:RNA polymerase sigma-70 factor (ECF subfamily)
VLIGRALGARVIATSGHAEKLTVARPAGADVTVNYRQEDWIARVDEETSGGRRLARIGKRGPHAAPDEDRWSVWMAMVQEGDAESYDRLLCSILPEIRRIVRSRLGDPASVEDVAQNVLLSIHRARQTYRPERPLGPWLRTITRNAITDAQRARSVLLRREVALEAEDAIPDPAEPSVQGTALSPEMRAALSRLPATQREAVQLLHLEQLSVAEAAKRVGVSPGALRVRAHRGYRALRERLGRMKR